MKLIITRPEGDFEPLAARLASKGHHAVARPVLQIVQRSAVSLPKSRLQAVCASSANGLAANIDWQRLFGLPFFAVGPQSAKAAQARGFSTIKTALTGNLNGLADLIATSLQPSKGAVLHLSGAEVSGDLARALQPHGISVERLIVYDAVALPLKNFADVLVGADGVLHYSPRSARLFAQAAVDAGLVADIERLKHFCLSPNVAAQLPQSVPKYVAAKPDESGMMELLDREAEAE